MKQTAISYGKAGFCVTACVVVAACVANRLNVAMPWFLSDEFVRWMRVGTAAFFATATLGKCGWSIQTYSGISKAEKWNLWIFRGIYLCGFGLLLLSFLIIPVVADN